MNFTDEYIRSLKESELRLLLPEKRDAMLSELNRLPSEQKQQLFNAMHEYSERVLLQDKGSGHWYHFFTKRTQYSIVPSESAAEILANGFQSAVKSLGPEFYKEVQQKASESYKKHIQRKKKPAMWLLKFLSPVIFLKNLIFKKK